MAVTTPMSNLLLFEHRTLFDVQLDECGVIARRQRAPPPASPSNPPPRRASFERCAVAILQRLARWSIQNARQQAASQASDAESRWLFRGEDHQLDRAPRLVTAARSARESLPGRPARPPFRHSGPHWESHRCASRWRRAQDPVPRRPNARTCCPPRPRGSRARPRTHRCFTKSRAAQIGFGKDNARDHGRGCLRKSRSRSSQFVARSSLDLDSSLELIGCRFQSL